ncbi:MAG: hypothetical protein Q6J33_03025 [Gloeomargarita sp. DG_2_bins_126]
MLTLEQRLQGCLLGAILAERWGEQPLPRWVWQPQPPGMWGEWLCQGCRYWVGQGVPVPTAGTAAAALVLVLPGLALCYPDGKRLAEVVATAGLPPVVRDWAAVLGLALQGQRGEPLADAEAWPELAASVADFLAGADDPLLTLTAAVRRGRSPLTLLLTGYLLGGYGGALAFPSAAVVAVVGDAGWRDLGTALLTRWAGGRVAPAPLAVAAAIGSR